jgi:hypothetical protein
MHEAISPLPNMPSWHGAQFKKKHRDNFYHVRVGKKILDTYMTWSEI